MLIIFFFFCSYTRRNSVSQRYRYYVGCTTGLKDIKWRITVARVRIKCEKEKKKTRRYCLRICN